MRLGAKAYDGGNASARQLFLAPEFRELGVESVDMGKHCEHGNEGRVWLFDEGASVSRSGQESRGRLATGHCDFELTSLRAECP
jgi:hypothetical protein